MTIALNQLPDDIFVACTDLGYFAVALDLNPDRGDVYNRVARAQNDAHVELHTALTGGTVEDVQTALGHVSSAWSRNVFGRKIPPSNNWIARKAGQLAGQIEDWLDEQGAGIGLRKAA